VVVGPTRDAGRERLDRNWSELPQELRVTQTGVQILSGFLLTLPFQARFAELSAVYRVLFLVALGLATLAPASSSPPSAATGSSSVSTRRECSSTARAFLPRPAWWPWAWQW